MCEPGFSSHQLLLQALSVTAEPQQTRQRLLTTDGILKGEASEEEERAEEAEETVVSSQLLQGKFIHDLQGRHKNKGQQGDDRLFSVLLVCQHLCQADTHHLSRHTNTTITS